MFKYNDSLIGEFYHFVEEWNSMDPLLRTKGLSFLNAGHILQFLVSAIVLQK